MVETKISFARNLRKNQTDAEKLLWGKLRNKQLGGIKFRRQQAIGNYIVDFVSYEKMLILELDGSQHNNLRNIKIDETRSKYLSSLGYSVMRFWNNEILKNTDGVLGAIYLNASRGKK